MAVSSPNKSFILTFVLTIVQGALEPNGMVSIECLNKRTFICQVNNKNVPLGWNIAGLRGISIPGPFRARPAALNNSRISSNDNGADRQLGVSNITISGFSISDNGGIIQCVNMRNNNTRGMATISVDPLPLPPPTNVAATVESCDVTLQWDQPSEPNDITTSVSCTPPSPDCAECTISPCTITGLSPSTGYVFTVTLNGGPCRTNMSTTSARTKDLNEPTNLSATVESYNTVTLQWTQPSVPNDVTTSVSCTPPSPGCAECTTSPCTITGLNPSTEYEFTVTLNSGQCRASKSTALVKTKASPGGTSSAPLAALAVLVLLILPLLYPLGVLIARICCFRDKSYCEVFWCCGCCRKDKSPRCNSTELMKSPHPKEEEEYQNVNKGQHIQFVTDWEENKDQIGNKQDHVVTYETAEQLGDDDGVVSTGNVIQEQGNLDGLQYADLDFTEHGTGKNAMHVIEDSVTYAEM